MRQLNGGLAWAPSRAKGLGPSRSPFISMKTLRHTRVEKTGAPEWSAQPRHRSIPHTSPR
jgi:hypothetical protein